MKTKGFFSNRNILIALLFLSLTHNHTALTMQHDKLIPLTGNQSFTASTPTNSDHGEFLDVFGVIKEVNKKLANKEGKKIDPRFDAERTMRSRFWQKLDLDQKEAEDVAEDLSLEQDFFATLYFIENIRRYIIPHRIGMEIFKAIKQENPNHKIYPLSNLSKYCITNDYDRNPAEDFEVQEDVEYNSVFNDGAVFSCNVGKAKPDEGIFKQALQTFNLEKQPVDFTDDSLANLKGARAAGLRPISVQCHSVWYFTCVLLEKISRNSNIEKLLHAAEPREFAYFQNFNLEELQDFDRIAEDLLIIRGSVK